MSNVKINGTLAPVRQPIRTTYDPQRGLQIVIPWESAGNNLNGLALAYQSQRVAYDFVPNDRKSTLIATASGGQLGIPDLTTDTWQILGNEIQKSGFEHPRSLALSDDTRKKVQDAVDSNAKGSGVTGDGDLLFQLLVHGSTHYALGQYVLKHTTNVSNVYATNVSDFNVERIYTSSQLIAEAINAKSWIFPMPGRMVNKIQNLAAPPVQANYLWGWRKLPSTEVTAAGNRIEITTEYWLEQWSLYYYAAA